jgi:hypothetical protein
LYAVLSTGGLFQSLNAGNTFESVFNSGNTLSVGAVAVGPGNPDVVYIGTGEGFPRNGTSVSDRIYKSTNGGRTRTHPGLKDSERFSRIVINPKDSRMVCRRDGARMVTERDAACSDRPTPASRGSACCTSIRRLARAT